MQEIAQGIYYENAYAGVTLGALLMPHGSLLIDAPLRAEDARAWRGALQSMGAGSNRMLFNLDSHTDRTLGARAMECTIAAHQKTANVFRSRPSVFKGQNAESGSEWESQNESVGTRWAIPDITFSSTLFLHWGAGEVRVEHHPGPAAGAIWVIIPSAQILFVGDAVVPNQPPFLANAEIPAWINSLEILIGGYAGYTIVSGRGGPVAFDAVGAQRSHLQMIQNGLDGLSKRNAAADETEDLVASLLADISFSPKLEEQYAQRLRHGLYQYYANNYRPGDAAEGE